jgi:hypothetical protein
MFISVSQNGTQKCPKTVPTKFKGDEKEVPGNSEDSERREGRRTVGYV